MKSKTGLECKKARKSLGLSQRDFSFFLKISASTIVHVEQCKQEPVHGFLSGCRMINALFEEFGKAIKPGVMDALESISTIRRSPSGFSCALSVLCFANNKSSIVETVALKSLSV